jgi:hypothetical protein
MDCGTFAYGSHGAVTLRGSPGRKRPGEHLWVTDMSQCLVLLA